MPEENLAPHRAVLGAAPQQETPTGSDEEHSTRPGGQELLARR
jgi:hypothetical protein